MLCIILFMQAVCGIGRATDQPTTCNLQTVKCKSYILYDKELVKALGERHRSLTEREKTEGNIICGREKQTTTQ